jgi:hypothetical protein
MQEKTNGPENYGAFRERLQAVNEADSEVLWF